jgi:hypothetical protein
MMRNRDTRDLDVEAVGLEKRARIDLGLALLSLARKEGEALTRYDIAAWAGCTDWAIALIEEAALRKLANALKFGGARRLGTELAGGVAGDGPLPNQAEVRQALGPAPVVAEVNPAVTRRAAARAWGKLQHGAAQIPSYVVEAMHAEYLRTGSLRAAGGAFGRTKQAMAYIFRQRGLPMKGRGGPNRKAA